MLVLFAGDLHGNIRHLGYLIDVAKSYGIKTIFQLGDFGYFPEFNGSFLKVASSMLCDNNIELYFIDGNHEDHPSLLQHEGPIAEIKPNLYHVKRGHVQKFGETTLAFLGGTYSVDRDARVLGLDWFEEEVITWDDINRFDEKQADILVSHDAPSYCDLNAALVSAGRSPYWHIEECSRQRQLVSHAVDLLNVKEVIHGHHHIRYTQKPYDGLKVIGLANDGWESDSWIVKEI